MGKVLSFSLFDQETDQSPERKFRVFVVLSKHCHVQPPKSSAKQIYKHMSKFVSKSRNETQNITEKTI